MDLNPVIMPLRKSLRKDLGAARSNKKRRAKIRSRRIEKVNRPRGVLNYRGELRQGAKLRAQGDPKRRPKAS